MTPAAAERLRVYQEGQRCAREWNPPCPYKWSDWRSGTWNKGLMQAREYNKIVDELMKRTVSETEANIAELSQAIAAEQSSPPLPEPTVCATCGEGPYFSAQQMREHAAPQQAGPAAIVQHRKQHCADWYDCPADHADGGGPYEERVLYTHPPEPLPEPVEPDELAEFVERSMRLAFLLGQTYWAQADSVSVNRRRLSKETRQAFIELREETRLAVGAGRVLK